MSNEAPLVFTSKGNVPADTLRYEEKWVIDGDALALRRDYFDASDELVSNSFHGLLLSPELRDAMARYLNPSAFQEPDAEEIGDVLPIPQRDADITVGLQGAGIGGQQAAMA